MFLGYIKGTMPHKLIPFFFLVSLLSISCTTTRNADVVYITDEKTYDLLPTSDMDGTIESYQIVQGVFPGHDSVAMDAYLIADGNIIDIAFFANTGQTIGEISYDGTSVTFSSSFIPPSAFKAEYIIADVQFALYDVAALSYALGSSGLVFTESKMDGQICRMISDGDGVVWQMTRSGNVMAVQNNLRGYGYKVTIL